MRTEIYVLTIRKKAAFYSEGTLPSGFSNCNGNTIIIVSFTMVSQN